MEAAVRHLFTAPWVQGIALLMLCSAYLQGAIEKTFNFSGAIAEMQQFGLAPAAPLAAAVIALEAGASLMIVSGFYRWLGALALAGFTLMASLLADRFWAAPKPQRQAVRNVFFEHWGLAGAFLLVAWWDLGATTP